MNVYDRPYRRQMGDFTLIHVYGANFSVIGQARHLDMREAVCEFVDEGQVLPAVVKIDIIVPRERRCACVGYLAP